MPALTSTLPLRPGKEAGFTLIEMMIAITIGLGILAGLVGVLAVSSSNSRTNDRSSELMTNGRYALNSMKQELRQAGFRAYTWAEPSTPSALGALTNECLEAGATAGSFVANIRQGIWGANNINPFSASCIPDASYADGNDVMVVRRLSATPEAPSANKISFQSSYAVGQVFRGATAPVFQNSPTPLASFDVDTYVYYIRPWTVSVDESPLVPALVRVSLNKGVLVDPKMESELVASGIEHLQVQYGQLSNTQPETTQFLDTLAGASSDAAATAWDDVNSVRIWLLARNSNAEPGYSNTNSYVMGDQTYDFSAAPDGFRRQLFTTVVQLRN